MDFFLGRFVAGYRIGARKARKILSKAVAGNESVEIIWRAEVVGIVIPSAHVRAGSRHTHAMAKRFQQSVFVQVQVQVVIVVELLTKQTIEQLYLRVVEDRKWWNHCQ